MDERKNVVNGINQQFADMNILPVEEKFKIGESIYKVREWYADDYIRYQDRAYSLNQRNEKNQEQLSMAEVLSLKLEMISMCLVGEDNQPVMVETLRKWKQAIIEVLHDTCCRINQVGEYTPKADDTKEAAGNLLSDTKDGSA